MVSELFNCANFSLFMRSGDVSDPNFPVHVFLRSVSVSVTMVRSVWLRTGSNLSDYSKHNHHHWCYRDTFHLPPTTTTHLISDVFKNLQQQKKMEKSDIFVQLDLFKLVNLGKAFCFLGQLRNIWAMDITRSESMNLIKMFYHIEIFRAPLKINFVCPIANKLFNRQLKFFEAFNRKETKLDKSLW